MSPRTDHAVVDLPRLGLSLEEQMMSRSLADVDGLVGRAEWSLVA